MVLSQLAMRIPESESIDESFEGDMSPIELHMWGYRYCKMANKPGDLKVF
jgi:hypothetical protein